MNDAQKYPCNTCKHRSWSIGSMFMSEYFRPCTTPKRRIDPLTGKPEVIAVGVARQFHSDCGHVGKWHSERPENKESR